MKPKFLLLFLFVTFIAKAQNNELLEEIKKTKNAKFIEYVEKQELVFNELESYLTEIGQQEFNAKYDSINSLKFDNLLRLYQQMDSNTSSLYTITKKREIKELSIDYIETRLEHIDYLYAAFSAKRFVEKKDENDTSKDSIIYEKTPVFEKCAGSPNENMCTADYIRKKLANNCNTPRLREINQSMLKTHTAFVINKNGEIVFPTISKSSGFFEFDMEVIKVVAKKYKYDKFIPAQQDGKVVKCKYTLPVAIQIEY